MASLRNAIMTKDRPRRHGDMKRTPAKDVLCSPAFCRARRGPRRWVATSVVATCERLGVETLATLDRRHFSVVCPRHRPSLTLVPD